MGTDRLALARSDGVEHILMIAVIPVSQASRLTGLLIGAGLLIFAAAAVQQRRQRNL